MCHVRAKCIYLYMFINAEAQLPHMLQSHCVETVAQPELLRPCAVNLQSSCLWNGFFTWLWYFRMESRQNLTDLKQLQNTSTKSNTFAAARWFHCRMTQTLGSLEWYTGIYSEQKNQPDKSQESAVATRCTADEVRSLTQIDCNIFIIT